MTCRLALFVSDSDLAETMVAMAIGTEAAAAAGAETLKHRGSWKR